MKLRKMYRSVLVFLVLGVGLVGHSCSRKPVPLHLPPGPARAKPDAAKLAPVVTLTVSQATVKFGQSLTLSWEAKNADALIIDEGIGNVPLSGSREVRPKTSVTYTATATGSGGSASASAKITVIGEGKSAETTSNVAPVAESGISTEALFDQSIRDVFFEYDKYELSSEAVDVLYANANFLRQRSKIALIIEGHCDERGTAEYNLALGDRRAKVVKDFLVGIGIPADRINTISYGEERPFDSGKGEEAWVKNRRAHFVLARP
jgi:peptidoglycan-associated lipoprotein